MRDSSRTTDNALSLRDHLNAMEETLGEGALGPLIVCNVVEGQRLPLLFQVIDGFFLQV